MLDPLQAVEPAAAPRVPLPADSADDAHDGADTGILRAAHGEREFARLGHAVKFSRFGMIHFQDRQIRSGNVLYDPGTENDAANGITPGQSVRIYTQANVAARGQRCVQYRIYGGSLQQRSWSTIWRTDASVSPWRIVADNVVNATVSRAMLFVPTWTF